MYPAVVFCTEATERLLILKWEIDKFDILHDEHNKLEFPLTTKKMKHKAQVFLFLAAFHLSRTRECGSRAMGAAEMQDVLVASLAQ
jgi:hypothetical protein